MNTVSVSLVEFGASVLSFRSDYSSFLSIVVDVVDRLRDLGHDVQVGDMGRKFFVSVR